MTPSNAHSNRSRANSPATARGLVSVTSPQALEDTDSLLGPASVANGVSVRRGKF